VVFEDEAELIEFSALSASIRFDFYIKSTGSQSGTMKPYKLFKTTLQLNQHTHALAQFFKQIL
jgi:hypothetical protein